MSESPSWQVSASEGVPGSPQIDLDRRGDVTWSLRVVGQDALPRLYTLLSSEDGGSSYASQVRVPGSAELAQAAAEEGGPGAGGPTPREGALDPVRAGERLLERGRRGDDVATLQAALNEVAGEALDVDGIFGAKTKEAVKRFQREHSLDVDGLVGPKTMEAIDRLRTSPPASESAEEAPIAGDAGEGATSPGAASLSPPRKASSAPAAEQNEKGWVLTVPGVLAGRRYDLWQQVEGRGVESASAVFRDRLPPAEREPLPERSVDSIWQSVVDTTKGWLSELSAGADRELSDERRRVLLREARWRPGVTVAARAEDTTSGSPSGGAAPANAPSGGSAPPPSPPEDIPDELRMTDEGLWEQDLNPNQAGLTRPDTLLGSIVTAFDSTLTSAGEIKHKGSSRRHIDHVNGLDGMTWGAFHFAGGSLFSVVAALLDHDEAGPAFVRGLIAYFERNPNDRRSFFDAAGMSSSSDLVPDEVRRAAKKTLASKSFGEGLRAKYEKDRDGYSLEGWIRQSVKRALREPLAGWFQCHYYPSEDGHLGEARKRVLALQVETSGAIASATSARSSGSPFKRIPNHQGDPRPPSGKTKKRKGVSFDWDRLPKSLSYPPGVDPEALSPSSDPAYYQDWWSFVIWALYNQAKGEIRTRMKVIWKQWYEPTWGPCPSAWDELPQGHSGVHMAKWEGDGSESVFTPAWNTFHAQLGS